MEEDEINAFLPDEMIRKVFSFLSPPRPISELQIHENIVLVAVVVAVAVVVVVVVAVVVAGVDCA